MDTFTEEWFLYFLALRYIHVSSCIIYTAHVSRMEGYSFGCKLLKLAVAHSDTQLPIAVSMIDAAHCVQFLLVDGYCLEQVLTKVIWEEPRHKVPIGWMSQIHPLNCPFPFDDRHSHLIHPSLDWPHSWWLTIPNGIRIHSPVLPQYTFRTDRPTDWHTDRQMG